MKDLQEKQHNQFLCILWEQVKRPIYNLNQTWLLEIMWIIYKYLKLQLLSTLSQADFITKLLIPLWKWERIYLECKVRHMYELKMKQIGS